MKKKVKRYGEYNKKEESYESLEGIKKSIETEEIKEKDTKGIRIINKKG